MATLSSRTESLAGGNGNQDHPVATHFAPAERSTSDQLAKELSYLEKDPVVDAMMRAVAGLVAVLNERRQVLAVNPRFLELLGIADAGQVLGLRVGEAVGCVHGREPPGGCGTTEYCSTCGAAIAQAASLATDRPVERACAIELKRPINGSDHVYFRVQACPVTRDGRRLLLLFLQDMTEVQARACLDRTFFHDVKNTLSALQTAGQILSMDRSGPDAAVADTLVQMAQRLAREIELQRCLSVGSVDRLERQLTDLGIAEALAELGNACKHHPAAEGRELRIMPAPTPASRLQTDPILLSRVLQNMVINALEATAPDGTVRVWATVKAVAVEFCVWNSSAISADVARRVFQRNFSTKGELGRGLGTYSMKLLGERLLGGQVTFTSTATEGTCFRLLLPLGR